MIRSFFIFENEDFTIERFHLCTWDLSYSNTFFELGFEIEKPPPNRLELTIASSIFQNLIGEESVICLAKSFSISDNSKFIFNDLLTSWSEIKSDKRNGVNLTFKDRNELTILPVEVKELNQNPGYVTLKVEYPTEQKYNIYFRILVKTNERTLAEVKNGLATRTHIFDIRINQNRNLPDEIHALIKSKKLKNCKINNFFCFHILPNNFDISFVDNSKLKEIRMLETGSFKKYLSSYIDQSIEESRYLIFFNKVKNKSETFKGCSFFSIFKEEKITTGNMLFAIIVNILSTSLMTFISFFYSDNPNPWYRSYPFYFLVTFCLVSLIILLPIHRYFYKFFQKIRCFFKK